MLQRNGSETVVDLMDRILGSDGQSRPEEDVIPGIFFTMLATRYAGRLVIGLILTVSRFILNLGISNIVLSSCL